MFKMKDGLWGRLSFVGKFVFSVFNPVQRTLETSSGLDPVCRGFVAGLWEEPNTDDDVREEDNWYANENERNNHNNIHNHDDGIGI